MRMYAFCLPSHTFGDVMFYYLPQRAKINNLQLGEVFLLLCNKNKEKVMFLCSFEAISSFLRLTKFKKSREERESKKKQHVTEKQNDVKSVK